MFTAFLTLLLGCNTTKPLPKTTGTETVPAPKVTQRDTMSLKKLEPRQQPKDSLYQAFPKTMKRKYVISIFLPMYLDSLDREQNQKTALAISRDFFKGMSIAADSLKQTGSNFDLHFFDSELPWSYYTLRDTLIRNKTDLVIGPILESRIKNMDSVSKQEHINWVSSLQPEEKCRNNEYHLQSVPSPSAEGKAVARLAKDSFKVYKIFVVNDKKSEKSQFSDAFVSSFKPSEITVINCKSKGADAMPHPFPYGDSNLVLIPSKNESFVNAVISKLRVDSQNITFVGSMQWQYFKSFEGELWEKYHFHVVSPYFIDYQNPNVMRFINLYRAKYNEEPTIWAIIGFDELAYYGTMMHRYGKYFQAKIGNQNTATLHTVYQLRHNANGCGWQNEYVNLLGFKNYQLSRIPH